MDLVPGPEGSVPVSGEVEVVSGGGGVEAVSGNRQIMFTLAHEEHP